MASVSRWLVAMALTALVSLATTTAGCHAPSQSPLLQELTGGYIPAPLPVAGESYKVIGYKPGIRFYVIQYNDKLYRGGDILTHQGMDALKALGIKTIVAVTPRAEEREWAKEYGMKYVEIPFGWYDMKKQDLDKFLATVDAGPTPIYVHCLGGDLRAGILAAHYLIYRESWSVEKALDEYYRLDASYLDSADLVKKLRESAPKLSTVPPSSPK
jgi:protein tyrosine phosphatase (PTP) superfamily phosphohydrolase (DUF442 family)